MPFSDFPPPVLGTKSPSAPVSRIVAPPLGGRSASAPCQFQPVSTQPVPILIPIKQPKPICFAKEAMANSRNSSEENPHMHVGSPPGVHKRYRPGSCLVYI